MPLAGKIISKNVAKWQDNGAQGERKTVGAHGRRWEKRTRHLEEEGDVGI